VLAKAARALRAYNPNAKGKGVTATTTTDCRIRKFCVFGDGEEEKRKETSILAMGSARGLACILWGVCGRLLSSLFWSNLLVEFS
jgi:hypothetical protein